MSTFEVTRCDDCGKTRQCKVYYHHGVDVLALCQSCRPAEPKPARSATRR